MLSISFAGSVILFINFNDFYVILFVSRLCDEEKKLWVLRLHQFRNAALKTFATHLRAGLWERDFTRTLSALLDNQSDTFWLCALA